VDEAQDLAQEVFLLAWRKLASLRQHEKFGSWLIGISKRVCKDWRRVRKRSRVAYVPDPPEPTGQPS
jgi:DNA-directed RNA polymerase specialized sigma24 family protein